LMYTGFLPSVQASGFLLFQMKISQEAVVCAHEG
jgi:hypothetical protein